EEDFGIVPLEAMACGAPVIAYGRGGVLDSVIPGVTGLFFDEQSPEALRRAVQEFETRRMDFDAQAITAHAAGFGPARFRAALLAEIEAARAARAARFT
ncbi:MAG: glycosyltransferase, partial [Paracoccus sp. (in: a-proteobacteria)]|nr:glycosyltransferase [Paracoccus sp. (in: a-proteobacteria)]